MSNVCSFKITIRFATIQLYKYQAKLLRACRVVVSKQFNWYEEHKKHVYIAYFTMSTVVLCFTRDADKSGGKKSESKQT